MNCSYRILKNVNIGQRVRKTADKSTVKFNNEPFSGAKIEKYWNQGFILSHENLPKNIWVDFYQLPLTKLKIDNGIIQDEITFVERLISGQGTTSMVLMPTHWLDYIELLHDKQLKDELVKYKVSDLIPGENVISAICRDGTIMTYLGKFFVVHAEKYHRYNYYYNKKYYPYLKTCPERVFFAIDQGKGNYKIVNYHITNKIVLELYKASDRGLQAVNETFTVKDTNLDMIRYINYYKNPSNKYYAGYKLKSLNNISSYEFIKGSSESALYITDTKTNWKTKALEFAKENLILEESIFETYELAEQEYNKRH